MFEDVGTVFCVLSVCVHKADLIGNIVDQQRQVPQSSLGVSDLKDSIWESLDVWGLSGICLYANSCVSCIGHIVGI